MASKDKKQLAKDLVKRAGLNLNKDYYQLSSSEITKLTDIRKAIGYKGTNSSGRSPSRQFWYYVQR